MAKSIQQLRKKIADKSAECEDYKRKYAQALLELNKQILENIEMQDVLDEIRFGLRDPLQPIDEAVEDCATTFSKEKQDDKAFSSRFMPNVKFVETKETKIFFSQCEDSVFTKSLNHKGFWCTTQDGEAILPLHVEEYNIPASTKEVSVYEAIPELVPDGMVYDKERDSLVKKP